MYKYNIYKEKIVIIEINDSLAIYTSHDYNS